jgi:hypothetical protein
MSHTAFHTGQIVKSRVDAQGLRKGAAYVVTKVLEEHYPFGTFVTYLVADDNSDTYAVGNGHLVLEAAGK